MGNETLDQKRTLQEAIRLKQWEKVSKCLSRGVVSKLLRKVVQDAVDNTSDRDFSWHIVDHCPDDMLDCVLETLVRKGHWRSVSKCLKRSVSQTTLERVMNQAMNLAQDHDIAFHLVQHYSDEYLLTVVDSLAQHGHSESVRKCLVRGMLPLKWTKVRELLTSHPDCDFIQDIVDNCSTDQLKAVAQLLVRAGQWRVISKYLKRDVPGGVKKFFVQTAVSVAKDYAFAFDMVPFCSDKILPDVIRTLTKKGHWRSVGQCLKRSVPKKIREWTLGQAAQSATDRDFALYMSSRCPQDMMQSVLQKLVKKGYVLSLKKYFRCGIPDSVRDQIKKQILKYAKDTDIAAHMIPHFPMSRFNRLNDNLVGENKWILVGECLKRGLFDNREQQLIVEQAARSGDDETVSIHIIHFCQRTQLTTVMEMLVGSRMWNSLSRLVTRGVTDEQRRWAVEQAAKLADCDVFLSYYVRHCQKETLEYAVRVCSIFLTHSARREAVRHDEALSNLVNNVDLETSDMKFLLCVSAQCIQMSVKLLTLILNDCVPSARAREANTGSTEHRPIFQDILLRRSDDSGNESDLVNGLFRFLLSAWKGQQTHEIEARIYSCLSGLDIAHTLQAISILYVKTLTMDVDFQELMPADPDNAFKMVLLVNEALFVYMCDVLRASCIVSTNRSLLPLWITEIAQQFSDALKHELTRKGLRVGFTVFAAKLTLTKYLQYFKGLNEYVEVVRNTPLNCIVRPMMVFQCVNPTWQHMALREFSSVWEDVRRSLFREAVREHAWDTVALFADHKLYDDERVWALEEALQIEQWGIVLLLADYGLSAEKIRRAHRQIAGYADWKTVRKLLQRGADISQIINDLEVLRVTHRKYSALGTEQGKESQPVTSQNKRPGRSESAKKEKLERTKELECNPQYRTRCRRLIKLENKMHTQVSRFEHTTNDKIGDEGCIPHDGDVEASESFQDFLMKSKWTLILYKLRTQPRPEEIRLAITHAKENQVWHVLNQLIRLSRDDIFETSGRKTKDCARTSEIRAFYQNLFGDAVKEERWGLVRVLMECGVDEKLGQDHLPKFIEKNQWILVARVMGLASCDAQRKSVIQKALRCREGSVVAHCIASLERGLRPSEQEDIFQKSMKLGLWQAVTCLLDKNDHAFLAQHEVALQVAIENRQWDALVYCLRCWQNRAVMIKETPNQRILWYYPAKCDIKAHRERLAACGETIQTMMHRAVQLRDWEAAEQLISIGSDLNNADRDGKCVLHKAIQAAKDLENCSQMIEDAGGTNVTREKIWNCVKLLLQHGSDVNMPDPKGDPQMSTPLDMFIKFQRVDMIIETVLSGGDVSTGQSPAGKTALHLVFELVEKSTLKVIDLDMVIHSMLFKGSNPLAVTLTGHTALFFASRNPSCAPEMVAKCIELGISTFQPPISDKWRKRNVFRSPFEISLQCSRRPVLQMLYESGSCSNHELFVLNCRYNNSEPSDDNAQSALNRNTLEYLRQVATSPRSLQSLCRLVISHQIGAGLQRRKRLREILSPGRGFCVEKPSEYFEHHTDVKRPPRKLWKYLLFEDILHPSVDLAWCGYANHTGAWFTERQKTSHLPKQAAWAENQNFTGASAENDQDTGHRPWLEAHDDTAVESEENIHQDAVQELLVSFDSIPVIPEHSSGETEVDSLTSEHISFEFSNDEQTLGTQGSPCCDSEDEREEVNANNPFVRTNDEQNPEQSQKTTMMGNTYKHDQGTKIESEIHFSEKDGDIEADMKGYIFENKGKEATVVFATLTHIVEEHASSAEIDLPVERLEMRFAGLSSFSTDTEEPSLAITLTEAEDSVDLNGQRTAEAATITSCDISTEFTTESESSVLKDKATAGGGNKAAIASLRPAQHAIDRLVPNIQFDFFVPE